MAGGYLFGWTTIRVDRGTPRQRRTGHDREDYKFNVLSEICFCRNASGYGPGLALVHSAMGTFSTTFNESPRYDERQFAAPSPLTSRELDVVKLVADGKTYKEIAQILGLSFKTVDCYSQRIKLKTQCHSVALLVRLAIRNGWVEV